MIICVLRPTSERTENCSKWKKRDPQNQSRCQKKTEYMSVMDEKISYSINCSGWCFTKIFSCSKSSVVVPSYYSRPLWIHYKRQKHI